MTLDTVLPFAQSKITLVVATLYAIGILLFQLFQARRLKLLAERTGQKAERPSPLPKFLMIPLLFLFLVNLMAVANQFRLP